MQNFVGKTKCIVGYMKVAMDVENKNSKVETCIVDLLIKVACQIRDIECEKQKVPCKIEKLNHEINTVGSRIV